MIVKVMPLQPHCFAFGGFEIQMLSALDAASEAGVDIQRMDPWSRDSKFDVLHVWGLEVMHLPAVRWAKAAGKAVVMTALLPYLTPRAWLGRLKSNLIGRSFALGQLLRYVDALVVVNQRQADTAQMMFGMSPFKIHIAPNIIDATYFEEQYGKHGKSEPDYILCTGNICRRKNQVTLAKACIEADAKLLVIGDVLTGEETYAEELLSITRKTQNIRWLKAVPAGSQQLVEAYRAARCFALISNNETQPISLLEAAATRCGLIIANEPYARQEFYKNAALTNQKLISSVVASIEKVLRDPKNFIPPRDVLYRCKKSAVGQSYAKIYQEAILERPKNR